MALTNDTQADEQIYLWAMMKNENESNHSIGLSQALRALGLFPVTLGARVKAQLDCWIPRREEINMTILGNVTQLRQALLRA